MLTIRETFEDGIPVFEINLNIDLLYDFVKNTETIPEWIIDPKDLEFPKGTANVTIKMVREQFKSILESFTIPNIQQLIYEYSNEDINYSINVNDKGEYSYISGKHLMDKRKEYINYVDVAQYFTIGVKFDDSNISENVSKSLSSFKIRISNHISRAEQQSYQSLDNVKLYNQQVWQLTEEKFLEYTTNIFKAYSEFLYDIMEYPAFINSFKDIPESMIRALKKYAIQGDFD